MNALEEERLCLREIFINVSKLFTILLFRFLFTFVVACLSTYFILYCCCWLFTSFSLYIPMLLLYSCLLVDHFVFGAFVYHFNNTIYIFVTILKTSLKIKNENG